MDDKHMKRNSISLVSREMQFKTIIRYHYPPARTTKIEKKDSAKCQPSAEKLKLSDNRWSDIKQTIAWKIVWQCLLKLNASVCTLRPIIPSQGSSNRISHVCAAKDKHRTFTEVSLAIAPSWKQPKRPSIVEQIYKWQQTHKTEFYIATEFINHSYMHRQR